MSNNSRLQRLYEACCGCCMSKAELRSREIDRQIAEDSVRYRNQVNVLFLGTPGSGKGTFIRQASLQFGDFDNDELNRCRPIIYDSILKSMKVLVDAHRNLKLEWQDSSNQQHAQKVLRFQAPQYIDTDKFMGYFESLKSLWLDKAIQDVYDSGRAEFQLGESSGYFLKHLDRVGQPGYLPTKTDALYAKSTKGHFHPIVKHAFNIHGITLNIICVNGGDLQGNFGSCCKRYRYASYENLTAILFLVSPITYDQVLMDYGDETTNRLADACDLFGTLVNGRFFAHFSFIVLFTKTDLLVEKIKYSNIKDYFPEFQGDPQKLEDVQSFLLQIFDKRRQERSKSVFYHFVTAVDTQNIRFVLNTVKDNILQDCLK